MQSSSETFITLPTLARPKMLHALPNCPLLRRDIVEPIDRKSTMLHALPKRPNARMLSEEPSVTCEITLICNTEPKRAWPNTLMFEPMQANLRVDNELPKKV